MTQLTAEDYRAFIDEIKAAQSAGAPVERFNRTLRIKAADGAVFL